MSTLLFSVFYMYLAGAEQYLPSLPVRDADGDDRDGIEGSIDHCMW